MGKSKTNSKSRSISKWKSYLPFNRPSAERTNEARTGEENSASSSSNGPSTPRNYSAEPMKSKSTSKQKRREVVVAEAPKSEDLHDMKTATTKQPDEKKEEEKKKEKEKEDERKREKEKEPQMKSDSVGKKEGKEKEKDRGKEKEEASVFEEVAGPAAPARSGTHGIKNKMRWKIDVDPVDVNGDQKMPEVLEKLAQLRKTSKAAKKCKVLKANEKTDEDDEPQEEAIINSARVLQLIKMDTLISKELSESEQEVLRGFCRSGDQEEKAKGLVEKIALAAINSLVTKNDYARQVPIPGQLRMFAVEEKKSKLPLMALMMARKDLLYVSWSKQIRDVEKEVDSTWTNMTTKKVPSPSAV